MWESKYEYIGILIEEHESVYHQNDPNGQKILEHMLLSYRETKFLFSQLATIKTGDGSREEISDTWELEHTLASQVMVKTTDMVSDATQLEHLHDQRLISEQHRANLLTITLIAIMAVLLAVNSSWINRSALNPVLRLHRGTEIIGDGNLDYKLGTEDDNEVGDLSRAFDKMTKNLKTVTSSRDELNREISERKLAEKALRASEAQYRGIFDSATDGIFILDFDGKIVEANPQASEMYGYSHEELINKKASELVHPDYKHIFEKFKKDLQEKGEFREESVDVRKDGKEINVDVKGTLIDFKGEKRILAILRDITEQKRAEESLRESEERFRSFSENAPDFVLQVSRDGTIHFINKVSEEYAEKVVGSSAFSWVQEDYITTYKHALSKVFETAEAQVVETPGGDAQREMRWYSTHMGPVGERGNVESAIVVARDITERKLMEEELERGRDYLEKLHNTLGDPVFSVKFPERIIDHANRSVEAVFGYTPEECIGKSTEMLFTGRKDYLSAGRVLKKAIEQNESVLNTVEVMKRKKGEEFPAEITATFLKEHDKVTRVIVIIRDITERKRAEEELLALNEHLEERVEERTHELALASEELIRKEKLATLGQLSGSIAHEIRNPLGVIGNSAYYLKMKLEGADEKVRRHLDILQSEVLRTNVIISDLLDFSKGKSPALVKGSLNGIVKDALKEAGLPDHVKVKTRFDSDLPKIIIDHDQIRQVFLNLFSNAAQAMPDGGTLKIITGTENGFVKAEVSDTGKGIQKENLEKIFEPLFTTKTKGTGLGLAIAEGILDTHKGRIEVKSREGKGTTFTVKLPVIGDGAS
ncbi:MAG: PAS domain S-box protein [Candidatus Hydrothermarchaeaceae archaeon]